jgi:hypothetical protein
VQWQISNDSGANWNDITAATLNSYTITTASTDNGKQYRAVYTNSVGTVISNPVGLTVKYSPFVILNPTNTGYAQSATASFTASADGNPEPLVQWQVSSDNGSTWNNISGATSATYAFQPVIGDIGNQYHAVFTNNIGAVTTSAATLSGTKPITTLDVGGVEFYYEPGFQVSGSSYTADGPVYLGYIPTGGTSFYRLLELNGSFSVNTSTLVFSNTGAVWRDRL